MFRILSDVVSGHGNQGAVTFLLEDFGNLKYLGLSKKSNPPQDENIWKIYREIVVDSITTRLEVAEGDNQFNKKWTQRGTLFEDVTLDSNSYSTEFNGSDSYATITDNTLSDDLSKNVTIACWMKINSHTGGAKILFAASDPDSITPFISLYLNSSDLLVAGYRDAAGNFAEAEDTQVRPTGIWTHVALVREPTLITLYVDGSAVATAETADTNLSGNLLWSMGSRWRANSSDYGFFFDGRMDDVCMFRTSLSISEISELYNAGVRFNPKAHSRADTLSALWYMGDGDVFPELGDKTGRTNTATLVNSDITDIVEDTP